MSKRRIFLLLLAALALLQPLVAQDMKPCATALLARRHQPQGQDGGHWQARNRQAHPSASAYTGQRRGLIILVSFPDQPFSSDQPKELWKAIANTENYQENGANGSVSDYFRDQSYGQFHLQFDVVGPIKAQHGYAYYGANKYWDDMDDWFDCNVGELVEEICRAAADSVSMADYDWDGDGEVEEIYFIYAGHGENDYYSVDEDVIWPHMAQLSVDWPGYEEALTVQGYRIDTYACSNEISRSGLLAGMGTICHEFSHCLGLPDLYNTMEGTSVLGRYDLMDQGNYNGNSWCPVGYSSYERYTCGWLEPLPTNDVQAITELQPLHLSPDVRIYRTSPDANDYYLVEYRQRASWDRYIPRAGLLAWHIDYDEEAWLMNEVNNDPDHLRVEVMQTSAVPSAINAPRVDGQQVKIYDLLGRQTQKNSSVSIIRDASGTVIKSIRPRK